jgi:hypothetical protein
MSGPGIPCATRTCVGDCLLVSHCPHDFVRGVGDTIACPSVVVTLRSPRARKPRILGRLSGDAQGIESLLEHLQRPRVSLGNWFTLPQDDMPVAFVASY